MVFADCDGHAVVINHGAGNVYAMPASLSFDHNTFVNTFGSSDNSGALVAPVNSLTVRDNIFYSAINMGTLPAIHRGNVFYMIRGAVTYALGDTEKVADPKFPAYSDDDFRLDTPSAGAGPWLRRALDHSKAYDDSERCPSLPVPAPCRMFREPRDRKPKPMGSVRGSRQPVPPS